MAEEHNLFLRWARLKQAAKERRDAEAAPTDSQAAAPSVADAASDQPFDLASLPSIEAIAADTDVAAFLRTGVPAELTRAALRRAWTSDPAIRDFIGIAENQWDFNDPNAIPGFGPLDPTGNAANLLAQVSRRLQQLPDALADMRPPPAAVRPAADGPSLADAAALSDEMSDLRPQAPVEEAQESPGKRRRGSALPR